MDVRVANAALEVRRGFPHDRGRAWMRPRGDSQAAPANMAGPAARLLPIMSPSSTETRRQETRNDECVSFLRHND